MRYINLRYLLTYLLYDNLLRSVGWPLVSVAVTGTETVIRGGRIQLVCKASGPTSTRGGGHPRSVLWVKDGRRLNSEVMNDF